MGGWLVLGSNLEALGHSVAGAVEGTRNDMSRNEFDRIDWKDIAKSLAAE